MILPTTTARQLWGPDGRPLGEHLSSALTAEGKSEIEAQAKLFDAINGYMRSVHALALPVQQRAMDPFGHHAWVFACAMVIATASSQAPFTVYTETEVELSRRQTRAKRLGLKNWAPPTGTKRTAWSRYIAAKTQRRLGGFRRQLEEAPEHPIQALITNPNPYLKGNALDFLTDVWLALRGEVFWVLTDAEGMRLGPNETPAQIWPYGPDCFQPILSSTTRGSLIGWRFTVPAHAPDSMQEGGRYIDLDVDDVVHFKRPDPRNPLRGISPIEAAAEGISTDLLAAAQNRNLLSRGCMPKGLITHPDEGISPAEEKAFIRRFRQAHQGVENAGSVAILTGGWQYQTLGISPRDMEHLEQRKWSRAEVMATMGVQPSILGQTETTNYATAQVADASFWGKTIIPIHRIKETALDATLFAREPDSVVGLYDVTGIDALRAGLSEKIAQAQQLCREELHMPPRDAFWLVGIEDVPQYEGDDRNVALDLLQSTGPAPGAGPDPGPPPEDSDDDAKGGPGMFVRGPRPVLRAPDRRWREFIQVQEGIEKRFRAGYRAWVDEERGRTLARFDRVLGRRGIDKADLEAILPQIGASMDALKSRSRPIYTAALQQTWDFTLAEIGVPVFDVDDRELLRFFDAREKLFTRSVTRTVYDRLRDSLITGSRESETIQQLRLRVAQVYDIADSSSKSLTVARTESAGFMNGARDRMFRRQGFAKKSWSTAQDEVVRSDHTIFGNAGPRDQEFDYLGLARSNGSGGRLRHPGDVEGPAGQVINCRCLILPEEE